MKKKLLILCGVVIVVVVGIYYCITGVMSYIKSIEANFQTEMAGLTISNVDLAQIDDGTYTGSYQVFPVAAEVSVTVKDHRITAIELLKHDNGRGKQAEIIPEKVVEAQSLQVDAVAGATGSSKVILKAIENALSSRRNL